MGRYADSNITSVIFNKKLKAVSGRRFINFPCISLKYEALFDYHFLLTIVAVKVIFYAIRKVERRPNSEFRKFKLLSPYCK